MRPTSEILAHALELFEGGQRWTQGKLFHNYKGPTNIYQDATTATAFCSYGAIYKSMVTHGEITQENVHSLAIMHKIEHMGQLLSNSPSSTTVVYINDGPGATFKDVQQMFCGGIKRALAEEETHGPEPEDPYPPQCPD